MAADFDKPYNPKQHEEKIYELWENSGFFNPDVCVKKGIAKNDAPYFSVALPPPNVTGILHLGHAFEYTMQDIMVRYHRMKNERTLWIPGTDHAAIATQAKYEKELYKNEKKSRHDFSREEFVARVHKFAISNQSQILSQLKQIGNSLDWSRLAFTLDSKRELAVRTAFKKMYDDGLIYRGNRIVNWDPKGQTTISDDEVIYEEVESALYTFRYDKEFPIAIATTRPETKVGDTAVAVHPDDARYQQYVGKTFDVNFVGVPLDIKIIADPAIDPSYGTGAVGITPAHSMVDWEIAERHGLSIKKVINEYARMENVSDELNGKKTLEAREYIVERLRTEGLLEKEEKIKNNISKSDRTGGIIEPMPKLQWFVNVNAKFRMQKSKCNSIPFGQETTLKEIMKKTVETGQIKIIPEHFEKIYMHWIDNLKDWCISRQILYGHRIPVWYCVACTEVDLKYKLAPNETIEILVPRSETLQPIVSIAKPGQCPKCNAIRLFQDPDTLDTWFSSALWTFSTLGWPHETEDLKNYHPTSVINPGYEILFLWVSRMIMMSGYLLGEIPFRDILFHGIVRDKDGRKFSKSLNNGIEPIEVIEQYGTDALRMALTIGIAPGSDLKFDSNKVKAYKHFANKIWNATRFVLQNTKNIDATQKPLLTNENKKYLAELDTIVSEVTNDMDNFRFYLAAEKIYHYFWHTFADKIIEESKEKIKTGSQEEKISTQWTIREILETSLKLLHPFMPFITETIWQEIYPPTSEVRKILMIEKWPLN